MILKYRDKFPKIHPTVFVADTATIVGDVEIGEGSSVWYGASIRGDFNWIKIGKKTSVQDCCVLHCDKLSTLFIGDEVTIGHRAVLHGCHIGNRCLIGMGSIILDNVKIGDDALIGAGSVVTSGTVVPPRTMMIGAPAKPKRELTEEELLIFKANMEAYYELSREYLVYSINPYGEKGDKK